MVRQSSGAQRREDYEEIETRRNPYLVDYEKQMARPMRETDRRGRRPSAYGSRMAGSDRQASGKVGRAMGQGVDPDIRQPRHSFEEEPMPEEECPSERWILEPVEDADYRESSRRREVTTDMFNGYRGHEPVRKGKIVQVPIPSGKKTQRRCSQEDVWQRQGRASVRQESFPERHRSHPKEEDYRRPESGRSKRRDSASRRQIGIEQQDSLAGQRGEGQRRIMPRQYSEASQETMSHPRREMPQEGAARSRREAPQARTPQQPRDTWQRSATRQQPTFRQPARQHPRNASRPRTAAAQSRRQRVLLQRLILGAWVLCILLFAAYFAIKNHQSRTAAENALPASGELEGNAADGQFTGTLVQGIPADDFARHPDWTEDFLTPNEYSRPGEPLESVKNIFVHYTANPGTSAAQNRSYFEWQKDTHEASVSAHFIIGYEGEIIQCVPLDEIAYAVMTRNYDSVSIECCYLAEDGSFTQETYDSLITLLAWLTDIYDLDAEDILRHYDCGGKKCPLYYTEHEDAWEQLKKDVDKL